MLVSRMRPSYIEFSSFDSLGFIKFFLPAMIEGLSDKRRLDSLILMTPKETSFDSYSDFNIQMLYYP